MVQLDRQSCPVSFLPAQSVKKLFHQQQVNLDKNSLSLKLLDWDNLMLTGLTGEIYLLQISETLDFLDQTKNQTSSNEASLDSRQPALIKFNPNSEKSVNSDNQKQIFYHQVAESSHHEGIFTVARLGPKHIATTSTDRQIIVFSIEEYSPQQPVGEDNQCQLQEEPDLFGQFGLDLAPQWRLQCLSGIV